jgi:hypothetical protein
MLDQLVMARIHCVVFVGMILVVERNDSVPDDFGMVLHSTNRLTSDTDDLPQD